jgi:hypothetical protein
MTENQVPAWTPAGDLTAVPQLRALGAAIGKWPHADVPPPGWHPANDNVPDGSMFNRVMEMTNLPTSNPKRAFRRSQAVGAIHSARCDRRGERRHGARRSQVRRFQLAGRSG